MMVMKVGFLGMKNKAKEILSERSKKDEVADVENQNVQRKNPFEEVGEKA